MIFGVVGLSFVLAGAQAAHALVGDYYDGAGRWRECNAATCASANSDWGADAATDALYLRWQSTHGPRLSAIAEQLISTSLAFPNPCTDAPCGYWSDTAAWDAVTSMREFEMTGDARALARARAAYRFAEASTVFAAGACPGVPYQHTQSHLKTLETLANQIKAALLLYRAGGGPAYLDAARTEYANARTYFLDPATQLYTVHVIDDGTSCTPVPRRYFASVNGLMIWDGEELAADLHAPSYGEQAVTTAHAVDALLSDSDGIFADTGGENDVVEPLVEAMERLAMDGEAFARSWIERNAQAALGARAADGSFARFFDGPPQRTSSIWESNGGFAVEIAAASLDPHAAIEATDPWTSAPEEIAAVDALPATIAVDGSAIALVGAIGAACVEHHVHVFVDGVEINDHAGIWLNPSMPEHDPVLFAWRWPNPGIHTITLESDGAQRAAVNLTKVVER